MNDTVAVTQQPSKPDRLTLPLATICFQGDFMGMAYHVVHVRDLEVEIAPWAQYQRGIHATFVPKGKRKARVLTQGGHVTLVVLEGHVDVPVPDSFSTPVRSASGLTTSSSRGHSFDPIWDAEFDAALRAAVAAGATLVADYRGRE
jgi:hypothetical protein